MYIDRTVRARDATREVLQQRQEIMWPDGTAIWLHCTRLIGEQFPALYHRATPSSGFNWQVFDLRDLVPELIPVLAKTPDVQHPGAVWSAMRRTYISANGLRQDIARISEVLRDMMPRAAEPAPNVAELRLMHGRR